MSNNGSKVLAVDDNDDALYALEQVLVLNGFEVVTASGGEEAFEKARSTRPDVILLDVMMPRINGYQVAREAERGQELRSSRLFSLQLEIPLMI